MKKTLGSLVLFSLLTTKSMAYIMHPPEVDKCITYNNIGNYTKAIEFGELAVKKYPKNPEAYLCLGEAYLRTGKIKLAYENFKKTISYTNDKEELMYNYRYIGKFLHEVGRLNDSLLYYNKALNLAKDLGDKTMQIFIIDEIAEIYEDKGDLDKALSYYMKPLSLEIDEKEKVGVYNNVANIYAKKGDYQKAIEYHRKAIEIDEIYNLDIGTAKHKLDFGETYRKIKDYRNAEKYLSEGLEIAKKVGDKFWEATGYRYLGNLYRDKGDKETAKEYYIRAYKLYKTTFAEEDAQGVLNDIKKIYTYPQQELDNCATLTAKNDEKAIESCELAAEEYPNDPIVYFCLGINYYLRRNDKTAYENFKKAESLTDNKEFLMYIYYNIGRVLHYNFKDHALSYYNKSLILAKDLDNRNMQAANLRNIANEYYRFSNQGNQEELDKALNYYEEFLNLDTNKEGIEGKINTSSNTNEKVRLLTCNSILNSGEIFLDELAYGDIATIYYKKGNYLKYIQSLQKGIEICEKYGNYNCASYYGLKLGEFYREKMKDYENTVKYFLKAVEDSKKAGNRDYEVKGCKYLGDLYMDKGDKQKAKEYYKRAYDIIKTSLGEGYARAFLLNIKGIDIKELDKSK
jgi:tetratricopeptide (TPR) repeat protein